MPAYTKSANELVHDEVREAILLSKLDTQDQRNSFKLTQDLTSRYNNLFSSESVSKVHKFRCRKFFNDYYKPLLVDSRFHFRVFNINGEQNVGVFASRQIFSIDDNIIHSFRGYRGRHISEEDSLKSHSVYTAKLFARGSSCRWQRRLEQNFLLLGSLSFLNHACEAHANCEPCNDEYRGQKYFHRNAFTKIKAKRTIKKGEEILISYAIDEEAEDLGLKCYICEQKSVSI